MDSQVVVEGSPTTETQIDDKGQDNHIASKIDIETKMRQIN